MEGNGTKQNDPQEKLKLVVDLKKNKDPKNMTIHAFNLIAFYHILESTIHNVLEGDTKCLEKKKLS